jgi:hypothetical protein
MEKSQVEGIESFKRYLEDVHPTIRCMEKSQVEGIERERPCWYNNVKIGRCMEKSQVEGIESLLIGMEVTEYIGMVHGKIPSRGN